MDAGLVTVNGKYPTRNCGREIDEGDFYQVIGEKAEDETLTDTTEKMLHAARAYICQEHSTVWRNAEMSVLGPHDQIVFVSGTQINKFVVTLDEKDTVKIYCREKGWNCRRSEAMQARQSSSTWRSLIAKMSRTSKSKSEEEVANNRDCNNVGRVYNSLSKTSNGGTNVKPYLQADDIANACEDVYTAEEYNIKPVKSSMVNTRRKSWPLSPWKKSVWENRTLSSVYSVVIGIYHMVKLMLLAYWQLLKCILKGARY